MTAVMDSESLREQALKRLAGLDMFTALDVKQTGLINESVLTRSLKCFDPMVFTDESVRAFLAALAPTPRGADFSIHELASLVEIYTQALPSLNVSLIDENEIEALRTLYNEAAEEQREAQGGTEEIAGMTKVRKEILMRVARRSMNVAKVIKLQDDVARKAAATGAMNFVLNNAFEGLNLLEADTDVTFEELQDRYENFGLSTSSLTKLPDLPAPVEGTGSEAAFSLSPSVAEDLVVEEAIVAGRMKAATDHIMAAQYIAESNVNPQQSVREIFEQCGPSADGKVKKGRLKKAFITTAKVVGVFMRQANKNRAEVDDVANQALQGVFSNAFDDMNDDADVSLDEVYGMVSD